MRKTEHGRKFAYYYPPDNKYWHNKGKWTGLDIDVSISFMCLLMRSATRAVTN